MGYGGNLLISGVVSEIKKHTNKKVLLCYGPNISDLFLGFFYDRSRSLASDEIYLNNPSALFNEIQIKPHLVVFIDAFFKTSIYMLRIGSYYERFVHWISNYQSDSRGYYYLHVNFLINTYVKKQTKKKFVWKDEKTAVGSILRNFNVISNDQYCKLYYTKSEIKAFEAKFKDSGLDQFVLIEPDSKEDWFGDLRKWDFSKWESLVNNIKQKYPAIVIAQTGLKTSRLLPNVLDVRDITSSFREACLLIRKSKVFLCTDGGLMHGARAINACTVVIWGGLNEPRFMGYPDAHIIVQKRVKCSPCGNLGWCDYDRACMDISVQDVLTKFEAAYYSSTY